MEKDNKLMIFLVSNLLMMLGIVIISYYKFKTWWFIIPFGIFAIIFSIGGSLLINSPKPKP